MPRALGRQPVKSDAISIVEAAYDCESEARGWLEGLLERVAPKLDRGFGVGASMYAPGIAPDRMPIASRCRDEKIASAAIGMCVTYPAHFHRLNATHRAVATASKTLNMTADEFQSWLPFVEFLHPFGIRDVTGVLARDPSGHVIAFNAPMPDLRPPTPRDTRLVYVGVIVLCLLQPPELAGI